ncbi:ABC transporter substrate-binding protein [Acrocarpospora pleiomorpha]|uniref:ABC transporter substrate-binding protein n=1 Tax=Acrocarpospora pleiomorpha TaxID=90975 RepID=A0A5M3XB26_9ACTN|nr:extracellular solute-binding protein [Acrocarpospora pleiomorpha]GES18354.1 ABC transporter substrate-binding protein [Acrocarpospora pleiomorpha]
MRSQKLAAITVVSSLLATVACGGSSKSGSSDAGADASGPVSVEFLSVQQPTDNWPTILTSLMDGYSKAHPGSTLKNSYTPQTDLDQKLQLLGAQNSLPVLFNAPNTPAAQAEMGQSGKAVDLEAKLTELGVIGQVSPAAIAVIKQLQGGKMYALPFELNMEGIWYNKKIFADNGITPPATWDELVATATTLNDKKIQPFAASGVEGWPISRLLGDYIFRLLGPDALKKVADGTAKLTDGPYVQAAQAIADLGSKGFFGKGVTTLDYQSAEDLFLQGKAGMFYMGSWAVGDFNDPAKNKIGADTIGYMPFPTVAGGVGTADQTPMNVGLPTMVSAKAYTPAVGEWLKYLATNYGDTALSKRGIVTGFKVNNPPATIPATTKVVQDQIAGTKDPVLWFEALFSARATSVAQKNAARLVTGSLSPQDYMSDVQDALKG